ncbi:hypothetical protein ACLB1G_21785 [Oxalobacteraceae bacterium A2-2]
MTTTLICIALLALLCGALVCRLVSPRQHDVADHPAFRKLQREVLQLRSELKRVTSTAAAERRAALLVTINDQTACTADRVLAAKSLLAESTFSHSATKGTA